MSVISPELRIRAFERRVSVSLWFLDTVHISCVSPESIPYCQIAVFSAGVLLNVMEELWRHTRSCAPSSLGCVEMSSLIL
jgi:hypothetical protein